MNIYFKENDIMSIRGEVWGKIFTRSDGKVEAVTVSPLFTLDCIIGPAHKRKDIEQTVRDRFRLLTPQEIKWMRKNHDFAIKCISR